MILALDPSTTRTGWAVVAPGRRVVDAGYIDPEKAPAGQPERPFWLRTLDMGRHAAALVDEYHELIAAVVLEAPSTGERVRDEARKRSMTTYGFGVGGVYCLAAAAAETWNVPVYCVTSHLWAAGTPKEKRAAIIAAEFPGYAAGRGRDRGMDAADAIGLGLWAAERLAELAAGAWLPLPRKRGRNGA